MKYPFYLTVILFTLFPINRNFGQEALQDTLQFNDPTSLRIKMTSVIVDDPNEAIKIYTEKLGFEKLMHMPEANLAIVVSPMDPNGVALMLEPNTREVVKTFQKAAYELGFPVIVMGVKDVENTYKKLIENGVLFKTPPTKTQWGHIAVFDDGCGNYIQIHEDETKAEENQISTMSKNKTPMLGLRTTAYFVGDINKAKEWYTKVFMIEPYFDEPFYVGFNIQGYELGLMPDGIEKKERSPTVLSYWGVEDIQKEFDRIIELGAEIHEEPTNVGGELMVASFYDPWGNIVGIIYNPYFKLPE